MARQHPFVTNVRLVPWTEDDFALLVRLNAPEMTEHLGGPETLEQLERRHMRYVAAADSYSSYIFKAMLEPEGVQVGGVNFWDREWNGEEVYEMGWGVLPEFQGRGIASAAIAQAVELARATKRRAAVHAFPSVENGPSNGICRRVGFTLLGEVRFEYPKGHWMQCNDWRLAF
ncbi:MAG: GNAT family N-acetyltransferase [Actinobacteria bacterium 13_1_40CM_66_12]|nr:MAG: GNAT family N-acetyltransferase [Actinobacteria bacterium 13_1_40CM_66_12]